MLIYSTGLRAFQNVLRTVIKVNLWKDSRHIIEYIHLIHIFKILTMGKNDRQDSEAIPKILKGLKKLDLRGFLVGPHLKYITFLSFLLSMIEHLPQ